MVVFPSKEGLSIQYCIKFCDPTPRATALSPFGYKRNVCGACRKHSCWRTGRGKFPQRGFGAVAIRCGLQFRGWVFARSFAARRNDRAVGGNGESHVPFESRAGFAYVLLIALIEFTEVGLNYGVDFARESSRDLALKSQTQ
jgi:hypothetical protein